MYVSYIYSFIIQSQMAPTNKESFTVQKSNFEAVSNFPQL
jgi:hypothetical protein